MAVPESVLKLVASSDHDIESQLTSLLLISCGRSGEVITLIIYLKGHYDKTCSLPSVQTTVGSRRIVSGGQVSRPSPSLGLPALTVEREQNSGLDREVTPQWSCLSLPLPFAAGPHSPTWSPYTCLLRHSPHQSSLKILIFRSGCYLHV